MCVYIENASYSDDDSILMLLTETVNQFNFKFILEIA